MGIILSPFFVIILLSDCLSMIDNNKRILIKLFDLDDDLVEDVDYNTSFTNNTLNIKLKKNVQCCPKCGSLKFLSKGFYSSKLTGCPINGRPTIIICKTRKYICKDCHIYFVEMNPIAYKNTNMTRPALINILNDLKPYTATYAQIARKFGISKVQVMNLFDRYVRIKRKTLPRILLIDEIFFSRKAKYKYPTVLMNFENKVIVDLIKSRKQEVTVDYFFNIPKKEKEAVEFICTDMSYTFKPLLKLYFPNSTLLVDHFHVVKYINDQLNNTRIRIMRKYAKDKKSIEYRLLKNRWKLLLKNKEDLDYSTLKRDKILGYVTTQKEVVHQMLLLDDELYRAHKLKEAFRSFDNISKDDINKYDMKRELESIIKQLKNSKIEEMEEVGETLKNWKQEILNSFVWIGERRISNGPIEGKNYYIKKIIYNANGMVNFERLRNRVLYSQNKCETYDLNIEYTDSIKIKSEELTLTDDDNDGFEE